MTTEVLGVDYAWQHPDPARLAADDYQFVIRYLSNDPSKDINPAERAALHAAGRWIAFVGENSATDALLGPARGAYDAMVWAGQARALGAAAGTMLLANVGDFAATPGQMQAIGAYYAAFAAVVRSAGFAPGGYGTGYIISWLAATGRQGWWWQNAMNDQGQRGDQVVACAHIYQRIRHTEPDLPGSYDENVLVNNSAPPFWTPTGLSTATLAVPTNPDPQEDDMTPKEYADAVITELREQFANGELRGRIIQADNASSEAERPAEVAAIEQAVEAGVEQFFGGNGRVMLAEVLNQILDARGLGTKSAAG